ncbi:MAG TPA: flagellar biosynthesis protein FlgM [Desulfobacterales bacterium]|nr:flagellar biosynthesis protein FlgM [Desulfobacterales bacterium]
MLWKSGRRSSNVDDRRGRRIPGAAKGGGIGILLLALVGMYFGVDPALIMNMAGDVQPSSSTTAGPPPTAEEQELADFVSVVLADTEDTWNKIFTEKGGTYKEPKLVLFTGHVESACGFAQAAMGPFYCPADQQVYIDLAFYQDLKNQLDAPGDFAQAYVIAHEIGHHVQKLVGISDQVQQARQQLSSKEYNKVSVKVELQADCFAGIWANHADRVRNIVEVGDIEEALNAASHIGDDRLQQQSRGYVSPDSFTHGSSKQRVYWFKVGYEKGTMEACDTFSASNL